MTYVVHKDDRNGTKYPKTRIFSKQLTVWLRAICLLSKDIGGKNVYYKNVRNTYINA
jgi:hypothetical protein